ncbi:MAG: hypothetical protein JNL87_11555 [Burkholderiaceae bacterium]|nr:hypothetical protein [Burkholderiaceae bacterium]
MQQLDIFADGRDRMLVNALADSLAAADLPAARVASDALRNEFPDDRHLAPAAALIGALADEAAAAGIPLPDAAAAVAAGERLDATLRPAALAVLGGEAAARWCVSRWQALARRARSLPFDPAQPEGHAAALWLRGEAWSDAAAAVEGIVSWRRIPAPLAWMIEARCRLGRLDDSWELLAELAWMVPGRFADLLPRLADPLPRRLAKAFDAHFEGQGDTSDLAWFPAWVLVEQPALAAPLSRAQPGRHDEPERAMRLLVELIGLERQGRQHDLVARRRALRDLHPALYALYLARR